MKNRIDRKQKLLIVEDEAIIAMDMQNLLLSSGYEVTAIVSSGEKALAVLEGTNPDFILMDIRLSGKLDGLETSRRIRERTPVPIIFVTAYLDQETRASASRFAPSGFVTKPIEIENLRFEMDRLSADLISSPEGRIHDRR